MTFLPQGYNEQTETRLIWTLRAIQQISVQYKLFFGKQANTIYNNYILQ